MSQKRRHLGSFRESSFNREHAGPKAAKSILIVTEGRNTEPGYFRALMRLWNIHPKVIRLRAGEEGIPTNLVAHAQMEIAQLARRAKSGRLAANELGNFDEVWIVFDTDHAQRQARLSDGVKLAQDAGFKMAHSTPCFEFWLALHYSGNAPAMDTCEEAIRFLKKAGGLAAGTYSKAEGPAQAFLDQVVFQVASAVRNARILTKNQALESFPANPSTAMHELVISIHESMPEAMKVRYPL